MRASELRLGNYVNVPITEQCPFRIDEFECLTYEFIKVGQKQIINGKEVHPFTWYGADLEPIPLTEEWLLKFGFEKLNTKMSDCFVFQKGLWRVAIKDDIEQNNEWVLWHERISPPTWCLSRFDCVHQLQNLHFALTGEELTLKQ